MSRLDAEYDPTEHHDLDRIEPYQRVEPNGAQVGFCACGQATGWCKDRRTARREHDRHRDEALGFGSPLPN